MDMIEAATNDEDDDPVVASADAEAAGGKPRRKLWWGLIAAIVLIAAGVGGYLVVIGGAYSAMFPAKAAAPTYIEVPPITVNLRVPGGQARFLKLRFMIVAAAPEQADPIRERLPMLLDALQPFLRELRPEDLNGSAALFRIKEEMMVRAHAVYGDGMVKDLLIQDLVQQ